LRRRGHLALGAPMLGGGLRHALLEVRDEFENEAHGGRRSHEKSSLPGRYSEREDIAIGRRWKPRQPDQSIERRLMHDRLAVQKNRWAAAKRGVHLPHRGKV